MHKSRLNAKLCSFMHQFKSFPVPSGRSKAECEWIKVGGALDELVIGWILYR